MVESLKCYIGEAADERLEAALSQFAEWSRWEASDRPPLRLRRGRHRWARARGRKKRARMSQIASDLKQYGTGTWRRSQGWCRVNDVDANSEPSHWDARAAPAIRRRCRESPHRSYC